MRNVEIKAKVRDLAGLLLKAKNLSQSEGKTIIQHDTFYKVNQGRLKLRRFESGNGELIYYDRGNSSGPKLSTYEKHELESSNNVTSLHSVLEKALSTAGDVKKIRTLFLVAQTRIHVDKVEGIGDFMELEVVLDDDDSLEKGEKIAKDLMVKLGIEETDLIDCAYTDLINKNI